MKPQFLSPVFTLCILFICNSMHSQTLDLIVTAKGDSVACRIDSISDTQIHYKMMVNSTWVQTHIGFSDVMEYKHEAIERRLFNFEPGTSRIISRRPAVSSFDDLQRNAVYAGISSLYYSRLIPMDDAALAVAAGVSFITLFMDDYPGFLAEGTFLFGGTRHFFEPGILLYVSEDGFWPNFKVGYRYQGSDGFLFRMAPLIGFFDGISLLPSISLGVSF